MQNDPVAKVLREERRSWALIIVICVIVWGFSQ